MSHKKCQVNSLCAQKINSKIYQLAFLRLVINIRRRSKYKDVLSFKLYGRLHTSSISFMLSLATHIFRTVIEPFVAKGAVILGTGPCFMLSAVYPLVELMRM